MVTPLGITKVLTTTSLHFWDLFDYYLATHIIIIILLTWFSFCFSFFPFIYLWHISLILPHSWKIILYTHTAITWIPRSLHHKKPFRRDILEYSWSVVQPTILNVPTSWLSAWGTVSLSRLPHS